MKAAKFTLALLALAAMYVVANGQLDKKAPPVIWDRTEKRIDAGLVHYSLILHTASPCPVLYRYGVPEQHNRTVSASRIKGVVVFCEMNYNQTVDKMETITKYWQEKKNHSLEKRSTEVTIRRKRFILGFLAGYFISNLVKTVIDKIFPDSHIEALYQNEQLLKAKIYALNDQIQVQTPMQQMALNAIDDLHKEVKELDMRTKLIESWYPQLAWTYAVILTRMDKRKEHLDKIYESLQNDKLGLDSVKSMLNSTWLDEVFTDTVRPIDFLYMGDGKLKIEFYAQKRAQEMKAYKVRTLNYWNFLSEPPTLMEYRGPKYLAVNTTNHCAVSLSDSTRNFASASCNTENWKDPTLRIWQVVQNTNLTIKTTPTTYIEGYPNNLIYCIGHNITVYGNTTKCPSYPFKLNFDISWKTDDFNYDAKVVQRDESEHFMQPTMEIELIHNANSLGYNDSEATLEKLHEYSIKLSEMQKKNNAVDIILDLPSNLGETFKTYFLYILLIVLVLVLLYSLCCKRTEVVQDKYSRRK